MISNFIIKQFKFQHIGIVDRVDLIRKYNNYGLPYYAAFCHFDYWYHNDITIYIQKLLSENIQYNLFYEEKSYWIINNNTNPLSLEIVKLHNIIHEQQYKIFIAFGYDKKIFKYRYNKNIINIKNFDFCNPVNKSEKKLMNIINSQKNYLYTEIPSLYV